MTEPAQPDIPAILDAHLESEFARPDVEATMRTMTDDPYLDHVPVMTGGVGRAEVRHFYANHFVGRWPADTEVVRVSRTVGDPRVVDELVVSFTHDVEMDMLLPGVPPTGREVRLPHVVVVQFEDGKVAHEHIYWDQASALVQVGLLEASGLPVTGAEQADKLLAPRELPTNELMGERWRFR
jgi:carboxymethylenebutenolidase